jgi:hypothetical protein
MDGNKQILESKSEVNVIWKIVQKESGYIQTK